MFVGCTSTVATGCTDLGVCLENDRISCTVSLYLSSRFKLLSLFLVPLEQQRKKPLLSHWTNQCRFLHRDNLCTALLPRGLETLSKRDFVVLVLDEMVLLQTGVVGRFEANESHDGNSHTGRVSKKKGCEGCRVSCANSVYNCCQSMHSSPCSLAEETEKPFWKRLCWLQVSVAFGGASCKNRQIGLQWKGVMGQLQPKCYPGGVLEALAGSREMHLPGEDCIANRPCPSLSVDSFGSRLASEHLNIFMINCSDFFFLLPFFEMDVRFALCSLINLVYDPF